MFPPKCIFCGKTGGTKEEGNSSGTQEICKECIGKISFYKSDFVKSDDSFETHFMKVSAACEYKGYIRKSMLKFKFNEMGYFYRGLSYLMYEKIKNHDEYRRIDLITSVPMHPVKEKERGYNQARLLAKGLSIHMGVECDGHILEKIKITTTQSLLKSEDRAANVKDSFVVKKRQKVKDKKILLVDDIFTTGATLNECSRMLAEAEAKYVVCAVLASGRML